MQPRTGIPIAYLITFRCYGTWLHGDERGSVSRHGQTLEGEPGLTPGTREDVERAFLRARPMSLGGVATRQTVLDSIRKVCTHRDWFLDAVNVRTNHVHVLIGAPPEGPSVERVMNDFEAYSTRALRRAGLVSADTPSWSRHGSTKYLWDDDAVAAARAYVLAAQGEDLGATYSRDGDR